MKLLYWLKVMDVFPEIVKNEMNEKEYVIKFPERVHYIEIHSGFL